MRVTTEVKAEAVQRALSQLRAARTGLRSGMRAIASALERQVQLRFDLKEDPDGRPWRPWSPATQAAREREGRGTLLEYTGRMRDSLASRYTDTTAEVGFGVSYAKHHEVPGGRRMLLSASGRLGAADERAVVEALTAQLEKLLPRGGTK